MSNPATAAQKKSFGEWFRSRKVQKRLLIGTFMIVPLLLLLTFTYIPFAKMVQFSFYDMKYILVDVIITLVRKINIIPFQEELIF